MKSFFQNKLITALIATATVLLAGVAVFTAIRLYGLRNQPAGPSSPESEPLAQANSPTQTQSPTPTTSFIAQATSSPTVQPTSSQTSSPTSYPSQTQTITQTHTPTPIATNSQTPTRTAVLTPTPTPVEKLPDAGSKEVAYLSLGAGVILLLASFALAL